MRSPAGLLAAGLLAAGLLALAAILALVIASCAPANERPIRGAVPGTEAAPTAPGLPPTLTPSEALRLRALPVPSPGIDASPSAVPAPSPGLVAKPIASVVASPSAVAAPPIVRTIAPPSNARVPSTGSVTVSAVLVGRGADLATASLTVNGADAAAQIDKRTPREWSIHVSQTLGAGTQTARVQVRDVSGSLGGFTWQFAVGEDEGTPALDH